ncbi:MAG: hypothetical protein IJ925_04475 [Muribaculaceae bacterium]|nr:hypothetical protein [Muribaculaceae bacterium]
MATISHKVLNFAAIRLNRMKRIAYIIIMLTLAFTSSGQAIQSINEQNMRFEKGVKPDPIKVKPPVDNTIPIDTNTVYYSLVDSAQH